MGYTIEEMSSDIKTEALEKVNVSKTNPGTGRVVRQKQTELRGGENRVTICQYKRSDHGKSLEVRQINDFRLLRLVHNTINLIASAS